MKLNLHRPIWKFLGFLGLTGLMNVLIFGPIHVPLLQAVFGFVWLFLIPGYCVTHLAKLRTGSIWGDLSLNVGFSVLLVMLIALAVNTILPLCGVHHPLSVLNLTLGFDVAWFLLGSLTWLKTRRQAAPPRFPHASLGHTLVALGGLPALALTILGAISLNNGGTGLITYTMLLYSVLYLSLLVWRREHLAEGAILSGVYTIGLSLLLMTSLRGWFTTGHDIQSEYRVFMLTLTNLDWSPSAYHDAYNACLSITILPTTVHQILGIPSAYVYKTVFQALFALVPVLVYLIARRFTSRLVALLAAVYFMAFPTYFQDMPMLNRQEIAFFFMSLAYFAIFNEAWSLKRRRWLLVVFGTGVVMSHYSTTYTMLFIFVLVIVLRYILQALSQPFGRLFNRPLVFVPWLKHRPTTVSATVVVILLAVSYLWSSQLTDTSGNVSRVAGETIQSIQQGLKGDSGSSDASYGLFSAGAKLTPTQLLDNFATTTVSQMRDELPEAVQPPLFNYAAYPIAPALDSNLALTAAGRFLEHHGLSVLSFNTAVRQGSALFLQLMLIVGLGLLFLGRPFRRALSNEYRLFQLASVILIGAIIALPVLSAEYGLLRAFQQVLILSGAAIVLATQIFIPEKFSRLRTVLPSIIAIGFLLSSTGVITASLGGYPAQIHLANSGKYYDLFYPHQTEAAGAYWLNSQFTQTPAVGQVVSTTETDRYFSGPHLLSINLPRDNAYPALIEPGAYVIVGYTTLKTGQATLYHNGDDLTYQYPIKYLDDTKDLLYVNQGTRVYK